MLLTFPKGTPGCYFAAARRGFFRAIFERAAHLFSALRAALGGLAGSRLAVYFVLCTRGGWAVFACGAGVVGCSMQVVSVFRGRLLIGAVSDGKVVGFYWREIGVGGAFLPVRRFFGCGLCGGGLSLIS